MVQFRSSVNDLQRNNITVFSFVTSPPFTTLPPATKMVLLSGTAQCPYLPTLMSPTETNWFLEVIAYVHGHLVLISKVYMTI